MGGTEESGDGTSPQGGNSVSTKEDLRSVWNRKGVRTRGVRWHGGNNNTHVGFQVKGRLSERAVRLVRKHQRVKIRPWKNMKKKRLKGNRRHSLPL